MQAQVKSRAIDLGLGRELAVEPGGGRRGPQRSRVQRVELQLALPGGRAGIGLPMALAVQRGVSQARVQAVDLPVGGLLRQARVQRLQGQLMAVPRPGPQIAQPRLGRPGLAIGLNRDFTLQGGVRRAGPELRQIDVQQAHMALLHRLLGPGQQARAGVQLRLHAALVLRADAGAHFQRRHCRPRRAAQVAAQTGLDRGLHIGATRNGAVQSALQPHLKRHRCIGLKLGLHAVQALGQGQRLQVQPVRRPAVPLGHEVAVVAIQLAQLGLQRAADHQLLHLEMRRQRHGQLQRSRRLGRPRAGWHSQRDAVRLQLRDLDAPLPQRAPVPTQGQALGLHGRALRVRGLPAQRSHGSAVTHITLHAAAQQMAAAHALNPGAQPTVWAQRAQRPGQRIWRTQKA